MASKPKEIIRLEEAFGIDEDFYSFTSNNENQIIELAFYDSEYGTWPKIGGDIEVLRNFKDLQKLEFEVEEFYVTNLEPLRELKKLRHLSIEIGGISDLDAIANLDNLKHLSLIGHTIHDLGPLAKLTKLEELNLAHNHIQDISVILNFRFLRHLTLSDNRLTDVSCIQELSFLEILQLSNNNISDVSFLENFEKLKQLSINGNHIKNIQFIEKLNQLFFLSVGGNEISSIKELQNLTQLNQLDISSNYISDITPLARLTSLHTLKLDGNPISDISSLKALDKLTSFDASFIIATNFDVISDFKELSYLSLKKNALKHIGFLSGLNKLRYIALDDNQISDISPIYNNMLNILSLKSNHVDDLFPLVKMINLSSLNLTGNIIGGKLFISSYRNPSLGEAHFSEFYLELGERYFAKKNYTYATACFFHLLTDQFRSTNTYDTNILRGRLEKRIGEISGKDPENDKVIRYFQKAESYKRADLNFSISVLEIMMYLNHPLYFVLYAILHKYINMHFVQDERISKLKTLETAKAYKHTNVDSLIERYEYKPPYLRSEIKYPKMEHSEIFTLFLVLGMVASVILGIIYVLYGVITHKF